MTTSIPDAPYYVCSTDLFMSGWGMAAGKTNRCVVPCESYEMAKAVAAYAKSRTEQKRVTINTSKPRSRSHVIYSVVTGWIDLASRAYPRSF